MGLKGQNSSSSSVERVGPTIAVGIGTLSYFGELNTQNKLNSPITSRMAYSIGFRQKLNYFLESDVNLWTGTVSANERSLDRNLNFETQLYGFGFGFNYNFSNFLKAEHILEPIIGVGIEVIGFSAKTDLYDQNGISYNYWSDGTIRNIPETDPQAEQSVLIQRDYVYESDIKTSDYYGLNDFNTYSLGIPITVGANLILTDKWTFRAAMIYHFTPQDLFDGVDLNSGNFEGDAKSDRIFHTSVSISYNFTNPKAEKEEDAFEDFSEFPLDLDEDKDGVDDLIDECLGHPIGVEVDEKGCPVDGDKDNVVNYKDEELFSAPEVQVDSLGVTITDAVRDLYYLRFYDETGNYSPIENETNTMQIIANKTRRNTTKYVKTYAIAIGEFTGDIPEELVSNILSLPDVNTYDANDKIIVAVGRYPNIAAAVSRQRELETKGIATTDIIEVDENFHVKTVEGAQSDYNSGSKNTGNNSNEILYRVQIGAFSKKADESIFAGLPNLVKVNSDDGMVRYYAGAFKTYDQAAKAKINYMVNFGLNSAFVVIIKGANIIPINNQKSKPLNNEQSQSLNSIEPLTPEQKSNLKFRVQLGSFKNQIPNQILEEYMELENIKQFKGQDEYIRYAAGEFDTYEEATEFKTQLRNQGFEGCYVVGDYFGNLIPSSKAVEMLKK